MEEQSPGLPKKPFAVRPRMSGGHVVLDVVQDDAVLIGTAACDVSLSAYAGAHALAEGIEDALLAAFKAGEDAAWASADDRPARAPAASVSSADLASVHSGQANQAAQEQRLQKGKAK